MAPPNRRNSGQCETKHHPDVFSNPSTQSKGDPPGPPGAAGRENEALENQYSDDYNSQDDDREEDEEEEEEKKRVEENADWHWQCHLCAHLNALPRLYRDFSAVPPCISQPCGNTDVPAPEPSYGPLRLRGPEPRSWEVRMRSRGNGGGGIRNVGGARYGNVGGGDGGDGGVAWKSAYQKLLEAEDSDGAEGPVMAVSTGVSSTDVGRIGVGTGVGISMSKSPAKSTNTSTYPTAPPPSTQCPHRRCEGCYDIDARMRVVRFCGNGGSGREVPVRLYAQWRAGFGFVEPGFDPPVVDGGLGRGRRRGSGVLFKETSKQTSKEIQTRNQSWNGDRGRNQNQNRTRVERVGIVSVGGGGSADEGRLIRRGGRVEEAGSGDRGGSGSGSGSEIGDATEIPRPTDELARTQMQLPRTRSPARYVAGESRILLVRSAGGRSGRGDDENDGDDDDAEYNSQEEEEY